MDERNSSITECVFEVRFDQGAPWDLTIPGFIYEKVKSIYPIKKSVQDNTINMIFDQKKGMQQELITKQKSQFLTKNEKNILQIGENLFSLSSLKPYEGWSSFNKKILEIYDTYLSIVKPKVVNRLGLRFINRIDLPSNFKIEEYFNFRPNINEKMPQSIGSFFVGTVFTFTDDNQARVQLTDKPGVDGVIPIIFDLDFYLLKSHNVTEVVLSDWLKIAHTNIESIFKNSLTSKLLDSFK